MHGSFDLSGDNFILPRRTNVSMGPKMHKLMFKKKEQYNLDYNIRFVAQKKKDITQQIYFGPSGVLHRPRKRHTEKNRCRR